MPLLEPDKFVEETDFRDRLTTRLAKDYLDKTVSTGQEDDCQLYQ